MTPDDDPQRAAAIARAYADLATRAAGMSRGWAVQTVAAVYGITPDDVVAAVMGSVEAERSQDRPKNG